MPNRYQTKYDHAKMKAAIQELVSAEDTTAPLSDKALVRKLLEMGMPCTLRVTRNLRVRLGIKNVHRRRETKNAG